MSNSPPDRTPPPAQDPSAVGNPATVINLRMKRDKTRAFPPETRFM